jgi:hypothetical protein
MVGHGEPDTAAGVQVQHRGEVELALFGGQLGQVSAPAPVRLLRRAEVALQQVGSLSGVLAPAGQRPAATTAGHQTLLAHQLCDGVLTDPPAPLPQLGGDPRRPIPAPMPFEHQRHLRGQRRPAGPAQRHIPIPPPVEPRLGHPQRPARGGVRHAMVGPLSGDKPGQAHRVIASFVPPGRPRLPQLRQLPAATTPALRRRVAHSLDTTDQRSPSTFSGAEPSSLRGGVGAGSNCSRGNLLGLYQAVVGRVGESDLGPVRLTPGPKCGDCR